MSAIKKSYLIKILIIALILQSSKLLAQEIVSIRTDRDIYIAGETLWLSANCLQNGSSKHSDLSRVVYVEVLNKNNLPIKQLKLQTNNGQATTNFVLPDTLSTGNYLLRAYTKWMRNYTEDFFYNTTISVINPFAKNKFPESDKTFTSDTVFFYPEGGKIIFGLNNKLVVHSLNKYGKGQAINGLIISPSGDTLKLVKTSSSGFNKLNFYPEEHGNYLFQIKSNEKNISIPLPRIYQTGVILKLEANESEHVTFKVLVQGNSRGNLPKGVIHIVTSDGTFVKGQAINIENNESVSFSTIDLPGGYLYAHLINAGGVIVSSRYFMVIPQKPTTTIRIKTDKENYSTRSPVSVNISNFDHLTNISVSVVKSCLLSESNSINSDLHPNNFPYQTLKNWSKDSVSVNDLLLCFKPFKSVLADVLPIRFLPEMEGEIISGSVTNTISQQPVSNEKFILSFVGKTPTIHLATTDSLGKFKFLHNRFGEPEIVIQPYSRDTSKLKYKIDLEPAFSTRYSRVSLESLHLETYKAREINKAIINMQVNALYKSFSVASIIPKKEPALFCFYGEPEITVVIDKFIDLPTMEEVFWEIVPSTVLREKNGQYYFEVIESRNKYPKEGETFSLVDGVPVWDANRILQIDPNELEKIEVINLNYLVMDYNLGRILSIFTKKGDMSSMQFDNRKFRQTQQCYSYTYLFSSPNYSIDSIRQSRIPDFRNLLFWNPNIKLDNSTNVNISFYTSDECTSYTIVAKGINEEGKMEYTKLPFKVKQ